jgi:hypothetical protein
MFSRGTLRFPRFGFVLLTATVAACSSDAPTGSTAEEATRVSGAARPDSTSTVTPNAVAGIRITPHAIALAVRAAATVSVLPVDANGVPSLALLAARPSFRVANRAIATVSDSGTLLGVAPGTTTLYATVGALIDSATIVVAGDAGTPTTGAGLRLFGPAPLAVGRAGSASAILVDAQGRVVSPRGKNPSFTVDDETVARLGETAVSDTAIFVAVTGVAVGRTVLHASIDGVSQSIGLTVTATTVPPGDSSTTAPPPPPVAAFTLTTTVLAQSTSRTDTLPAPLAAATVTVFRLERGGASVDTLGTRVQVATATTDAAGLAVFRALPSGTYTVVAQPPVGSALTQAESTFGPPRVEDYRIGFVLLRR